MKFIHVYNEKYFDGLVKNDMLNKDSGFKIQHNFSMPNEAKFNEIEKKGGKLYNYIKAFDALEFSYDMNMVHNPTATTVWFDYNDKSYRVESGETISL